MPLLHPFKNANGGLGLCGGRDFKHKPYYEKQNSNIAKASNEVGNPA